MWGDPRDTRLLNSYWCRGSLVVSPWQALWLGEMPAAPWQSLLQDRASEARLGSREHLSKPKTLALLRAAWCWFCKGICLVCSRFSGRLLWLSTQCLRQLVPAPVGAEMLGEVPDL